MNKLLFYIIIIVAPILLCHCEDCLDKTIRVTKSKEVLSIENYSKDNNQGNAIILDPVMINGKEFSNKIDVSIMQSADLAPLSNFILGVSIDNDSYYAISEKYRFDETPITSKSDTLVKFQIDLYELSYISPTNNKEINGKEFMEKFKETKQVHIWATINDMSLLNNPLSSSSLRHSGSVEINFKIDGI